MMATLAAGQEQSVKTLDSPDVHYQFAWQFQRLAEVSNSPLEDSKANLARAIEQCDVALKMKTNLCRAAALAAHCSYRLTQLETNAIQHDASFRAACDRFEAAARCGGGDAALFREWAGMLTAEANAHPDIRDRLALLQEARRTYESGLATPDFSGERAKLERDLGTCLVVLAQQTAARADRLALYDRAIHLFTAATNVDSVAVSPQLCAHWGIALVESAKLTGDHMKLRWGIERLETALESDPRNQEARYNLVCAYALLNEPAYAMRHLRICLEGDDARRTYYNIASHDPDLDSLRRTRDYNEIFSLKPAMVVPTPRISNQ
jgi:hypothetical protein